MPLIIALIQDDPGQEVLGNLVADIAAGLEKETGIPEKNTHTFFFTSLFKGKNGPKYGMNFAVILTGFFWGKPAEKAKAGTRAVAKVMKAWLEGKTEVFAISLNPDVSTLLK